MSALTPYLCVADGHAAIEWYVRVLGAEVTFDVVAMDDGRVGHVELTVDLGAGPARWMMSDEFEGSGVAGPAPGRGNDVSLHVDVGDAARLDALAAAMAAAGADLQRGPEDNPHAGRVAVLRDPFGHRWFLAAPLA